MARRATLRGGDADPASATLGPESAVKALDVEGRDSRLYMSVMAALVVVLVADVAIYDRSG